MSKVKMNKKTLIALVILAVLVVAAVIIFFVTKPQTSVGKKNITISVANAEGSITLHEISTAALYLSEVLAEQSLVPKEDLDQGFVTTIDGISADFELEEWWMMTVNGEFSNYGINELVVEDGFSYEFILSVGWDF